LNLTYNCISNLDFVEVKITYFLFMETCFSFILHEKKIILTIILTKHIFFIKKSIFLRAQLIFFYIKKLTFNLAQFSNNFALR
jgi:hypothetical protein